MSEINEAIARIESIGDRFDRHSPISENARRAGLALLGLIGMAANMGPSGTEEPLETLVQDMLTNLRHLVDLEGMDIESVARQADDRYDEELAGACDEVATYPVLPA